MSVWYNNTKFSYFSVMLARALLTCTKQAHTCIHAHVNNNTGQFYYVSTYIYYHLCIQMATYLHIFATCRNLFHLGASYMDILMK